MDKSDLRIHEGELNVMELLWSNKSLQAKEIANILKEYIGWEKNTTYTVIKRLIDKGVIKREDPGYVCTPLLSKQRIQEIETKVLLDKLFNGSLSDFFSDYLSYQKLSSVELLELEKIINEQKYPEFQVYLNSN